MLKKHAQADRADERKAIKTYGKRQSQHPQHAAAYSEMQKDEQDHERKLSGIIQGLQKAGIR